MGVDFYDFGIGEFVPGQSISHYLPDICHRLYIYRFVKCLSFFLDISSKLSSVNDCFQLPTCLIDEHCPR